MKFILFFTLLGLTNCHLSNLSTSDLNFGQEVIFPGTWESLSPTPLSINPKVLIASFKSKDSIVYVFQKPSGQLIHLSYNKKQGTVLRILPIPPEKIYQLFYAENNNKKYLGYIMAKSSTPTGSGIEFQLHKINNNFSLTSILSTQLNQYTPQVDIPFIMTLDNEKSSFFYVHNTQLVGSENAVAGGEFDIKDSSPIFAPYRSHALNLSGGEIPYFPKKFNSSTGLIYNLYTLTNSVLEVWDLDNNSSSPGKKTYTDGQKTGVFSLPQNNTIWLTHSPSLNKMSITKLETTATGDLIETTVKTGIEGSKGVIAKESGSNPRSYYLAMISSKDGLQVLKTSDNFNTLSLVGTKSIETGNFTNIQLNIVGDEPIVSYIKNNELKILRFGASSSSSSSPPSARINITSKIVANKPFNVSALSSTGNNLTYFWSIIPNHGAFISDPLGVQTSITLPPSTTKIVLEVNNGRQSSRTTTTVTVR